jgi:hypothetical protein
MSQLPIRTIALSFLLVCAILFNIASICGWYILLIAGADFGGAQNSYLTAMMLYPMPAAAMLVICGIGWWKKARAWAIGFAVLPPVTLIAWLYSTH